MAASEESLSAWQKALRKLREAQSLPADAMPGPVVVSSYFAIRSAAVAALLNTDGSSPSAETAIIARFGALVGAEGAAHGLAFNRVFDLRNVEDYDANDTPGADEAKGARDDAVAFIAYCASRFGFPAAEPPAGEAP